jgi:hypothetical protein
MLNSPKHCNELFQLPTNYLLFINSYLNRHSCQRVYIIKYLSQFQQSYQRHSKANMFIKKLCKIFLEKIKYRTSKSKIRKQIKSKDVSIKERESIEKNITVPIKSVESGNHSKRVSQDFIIYEDLADEEFSKYLKFNVDSVLMNGEINDSFSNFEDFLEYIDKEEEGIFANIVFPNSTHAVELSSDNINEVITVEIVSEP